MTDQLIAFETAKLAKEKGFKERCYASFNPETQELENTLLFAVDSYLKDIIDIVHDHTDMYSYNSELNSRRIDAPTQSLLQRWLRENHNLIVFVAPFKDHASDVNDEVKWNYTVYNKKIGKNLKSYKKALEVGLQEALKLIK